TRGGPADREENDGRARRPERVAGQLPTDERETEPGDPAKNDPGSRSRERDPERTLHARRRGCRRLHVLDVSAEPVGFLSESTSWFPGGAVLREAEWPRKLPSGGLSSRIRAGSTPRSSSAGSSSATAPRSSPSAPTSGRAGSSRGSPSVRSRRAPARR